jgi:outer membrane protein TolC
MPESIAAEIPADLLRRRPDVRAAELAAAAQSEQIGIAKADLYPALSLGGSVGLTRTSLGGITNAVDIGVGPSLRWNLLDFGRIRGNVRVQDARFQQTVEAYQEAVLQAAHEVDDAAIGYAKSREEAAVLLKSQEQAERALEIAQRGYKEGYTDFERVLTAQASLFLQQNQYITNEGQSIGNLVAVYKAIGGGWIASTEADYANPETRATMEARTNWGGLLELTATPAAAPTKDQPKP